MNDQNEGHLHPSTQALRQITSIFRSMDFELADGPEIETEYYNFDALNIPADHPSRDMQDTFWLKHSSLQENMRDKPRCLLRTQTSPIQVRYMENNKPPIRIIAPGKVYRNEATDATHECQFYQFEGLVVEKGINITHLKGVVEKLFKEFLGDDVKMRFRPSYFPFTEPSIEIDVFYGGKWLEVMGAGMVHPFVLESVGVDPKEWGGFAFGTGLDRLLMAKHQIDDVRLLYSGDLRFVNQF